MCNIDCDSTNWIISLQIGMTWLWVLSSLPLLSPSLSLRFKWWFIFYCLIICVFITNECFFILYNYILLDYATLSSAHIVKESNWSTFITVYQNQIIIIISIWKARDFICRYVERERKRNCVHTNMPKVIVLLNLDDSNHLVQVHGPQRSYINWMDSLLGFCIKVTISLNCCLIWSILAKE